MRKIITYVKKVNDVTELNDDILKDIDSCLAYNEPELLSIFNNIAYKNKYGGCEMADLFPSFEKDGTFERYTLNNGTHYLIFNVVDDVFCKERNAIIFIEVVVEYSLAVKLILDWTKRKKINLPEQLVNDLINKELPPIEDLEYLYESPKETEGYIFV